METTKQKRHWYSKFTLFCLIFAFLPLIILLLCYPYLYYQNCTGGAAGFHCDNPNINEFATSVISAGSWGTFFTVAAAATLWIIVTVLYIIKSIFSSSKEGD